MSERAPLEVLGLRRRFGAREALSGVDVRVEAGSVHGLLGPNGAGKTTLMRITLGLVRPDGGSVRLCGALQAPLRGGLPPGVAGFVETPGFYPYLSARRNLELLGRLDGGAPAGAVDDALARVGLVEVGSARVRGFSAGMRQRLALAAALLRRPRLLMLDEPTSSLDPAGARQLREHVRELAGEGVAVLFSSHDMSEVEDLCDTLTILSRGRVVFAGTMRELRARAPGDARRLWTSDDARAAALGAAHPGVTIAGAPDADGLDIAGSVEDLDRYVVALGRADVAVRALEGRGRSLEALFLRLTEEAS